MELFVDEHQLMHHKYLYWRQASVLHPGEYYWTWQTTEGHLRQLEYAKSHPDKPVIYRPRRITRTLRDR